MDVDPRFYTEPIPLGPYGTSLTRCNSCGGAVLLDPWNDTTRTHDEWHEEATGGR